MAKKKAVAITPFWDSVHRTNRIVATKQHGLHVLTFKGHTDANAIDVTLRPGAAKNAAAALSKREPFAFSDLYQPKTIRVKIGSDMGDDRQVFVVSRAATTRFVALGKAQRARLAAFLTA